jgi:hypothetical protein
MIRSGEVIDFVGGRADIAAKLSAAIGDPRDVHGRSAADAARRALCDDLRLPIDKTTGRRSWPMRVNQQDQRGTNPR